MTEAVEAQTDNFTDDKAEQENDNLLSGVDNDNDETTVEDNNEPDTKPDYSYVPEKFLNEDGEPDFEKLAKSYSALEKKLGNKAAQAPESIDEYEYDFKDPEVVNNEEAQKFKEEALEHGLTKEQYQWLMGYFEQMNEANTKASIDYAENTLKEAWGDAYEDNLVNARKAYDVFADEDMNIDEIGNNPTIIKLLAKIGAEIGEDSNVNTKAAPAQGMTELEIQELMSSDDYWTNSVKQKIVQDWFRAKHGE